MVGARPKNPTTHPTSRMQVADKPRQNAGTPPCRAKLDTVAPKPNPVVCCAIITSSAGATTSADRAPVAAAMPKLSAAVVARRDCCFSPSLDDDDEEEDVKLRCKCVKAPLVAYWKAEMGPIEAALTSTPL